MSKLVMPNWESSLVAAHKRAKDRLQVMDMICEALVGFDGQVITKRLATAVNKRLGKEVSVHYRTDMGWHEVMVWGTNIWGVAVDYNDRIVLNLGYKSSNVHPTGAFNYSWFLDHNQGFRGAVKRLEPLMENLEEMRKFATVFERIDSQVEDLVEDMKGQLGVEAIRVMLDRAG